MHFERREGVPEWSLDADGLTATWNDERTEHQVRIGPEDLEYLAKIPAGRPIANAIANAIVAPHAGGRDITVTIEAGTTIQTITIGEDEREGKRSPVEIAAQRLSEGLDEVAPADWETGEDGFETRRLTLVRLAQALLDANAAATGRPAERIGTEFT